MSSVIIKGDTSGQIEIASPAVAGSNTQTLVPATGTLAPLIAATAQTASGSSVDFTGIPSWVKRITVSMIQVSTAAAGAARIRLGTSSGLVTTGYFGTLTNFSTSPGISQTALSASPEGIAGFGVGSGSTEVNGQFVIVNLTGNTWQCAGNLTRAGDSLVSISSGFIALSGTLDRLSLVATTSTFDAGTINILYE